ncbi:hypothetical protein N8152_01955 [bacterium]|nr:hypothetical protein [bacterium]
MGDEENAEMNAQQKAKPDAQPGGSSKSSLLDTYAPVPDFFYDVKREIEPIGSSSTRVRHLATVLYMSTIFVLFGSLLYNYMPAQRISQESIVTSEWQKDGFVCKPLQKTTIDGLSTDWSFDECVAGVSSPNVDTVITVEKSDSSTQFDYRFATQGDTSGSLSFWDTWNGNAFTSDDWQKDGFVCKPLQRATIHGLSTDWSYDECVSGVSVADTSTVTAVRKHHEDHFDYAFVSGGVISFYDDAYDSSVLQKTNAATDDWKRDEYACYPEPPYDNTYNLNYNFSECFDGAIIMAPSEESVKTLFLASTSFVYYPFGIENSGYPEGLEDSGLSSGTNPPSIYSRLENKYCCTGMCGPLLPGGARVGSGTGGGSGALSVVVQASFCEADTSVSMDSAISAWKEILDTTADQYGNFGNETICNAFKRNGNGFRCLDKPKPPATKELAIERYASEYPSETICTPLKQNSPFRCTPIDTPPATKELAIESYASEYPAATICTPLKQNSPFQCTPIDTPPSTKELAIERYIATYTPETICAPLKQNSPFQCTRNVEVPTATILSLSVASAQAVFAVGGLVFVSFLRKLEKPGKNTATSVDDDLRVLVRKLRVAQEELRVGQEKLRGGQDELRREFCSRQEELRGDQSRHEELIQKLIEKAGDHQA